MRGRRALRVGLLLVVASAILTLGWVSSPFFLREASSGGDVSSMRSIEHLLGDDTALVTEEAESCFRGLGYEADGRLIVLSHADGSITFMPAQAQGSFIFLGDAIEPLPDRTTSLSRDEVFRLCDAELKERFPARQEPVTLQAMPAAEASAFRDCLNEAGVLSELTYLSLQVDAQGFPMIEFRHGGKASQDEEDAIAGAIATCTVETVGRLMGPHEHE
jgi:hypothetical protein